MSGIFVVATNTLRETIRRRLYFNIAVFGTGMLVLSMIVGNLTFGYPDRVVRSIGLSGVTLALDLMALLVSVALVHEEIDRKTLFVVLARPIERWQYLVGRYLGLLASVCLAALGFLVVYTLTMVVARGELTSNDVLALAAGLPEAAVLGAFGLLLSTVSSPTLAAGVGLAFWISAASVDDLVNLAQASESGLDGIAQVVAWVLPNFSRFNLREAAVYADTIAGSELISMVLYGGMYAACYLLIASVALTRRDMV